MKIIAKALIFISILSLSHGQGLKSIGTYMLGSYDTLNGSTVSSQKTYYLTKLFQVDWLNAFEFCKRSNMELVRIDSSKELKGFLSLCNKNVKEFVPSDVGTNPTAFIGAVKSGPRDAMWFETSTKLDFPIPWGPSQPSAAQGPENCIAVTSFKGSFAFEDVPCFNYFEQFICQDVKTAGKGLKPAQPKKG